jgi:uracil-DNA glycosylase
MTTSPLDALVERICLETGRPVPITDPDGPGQQARVLIVLRDPGELGARKSGVLSPVKNDDQTARNMRRLLAEAGLELDVCLFWNAVPWALEGRRKPRAGEVTRGATYLRELVGLLPNLRAVIAMGREAQDACRQAQVPAIEVCHPGPLGLHGGPTAAAAQRRRTLTAGLVQAANLSFRPD